MTHEQISALIQINQELGEIRAAAPPEIASQIESVQKKIAELFADHD